MKTTVPMSNGGKRVRAFSLCLFIFIFCLFTSAIWSRKLYQHIDWLLQSSFPAFFHWNASFSKNTKSAFYQRILDEDRRREFSKDFSKSPNCTRLLRHLGSEDDLYDCPNCRYFTYCHRLGFLLDNCIANEISQNNFISHSSVMTNSVSNVDKDLIDGSNLLVISFDPIGSNRHIFTKKLLSNFVSSLQKTKINEPVLHTPAVSCQSFVSAINLESKKSRVLIYGPKTFGIHEVLSQDRSNMYILWAKHPFQQIKDTYEFLYNNWNYIQNAFPKKVDEKSRNYTAYFTDIEKFMKSSNGSLEQFLFSVSNISVAFLDNQIIRSLLYSMPVFPSNSFNSSYTDNEHLQSRSATSSPSAGVNNQNSVKEERRWREKEVKLEKVGIENNDLNFFQSHEQSITLREPPVITQMHYTRAIFNIRKYVAYVGVNEQFEESTQMLCYLLNLSHDCFGGSGLLLPHTDTRVSTYTNRQVDRSPLATPPTEDFSSSHSSSSTAVSPDAAFASASSSSTTPSPLPGAGPSPGTKAGKLRSSRPTPPRSSQSSKEPMKERSVDTSLSASVIDILEKRNFWDLKLYSHLRELSHYQLQIPLANHFLPNTSERNTS